MAERDEQVAHAAGVGAERVVAARLGDWPWPSRSGAITVKWRVSSGKTRSHVRDVDVIPCTSTSTGPLPPAR